MTLRRQRNHVPVSRGRIGMRDEYRNMHTCRQPTLFDSINLTYAEVANSKVCIIVPALAARRRAS